MARITSDYDSHTKDELLAEATARGITDVSSNSLKADIVSALEDADTAPPQPPAPLPPLKPSSLPQVTKVELPPVPGDDPKDEEYSDGVFKKKGDGEDYALCIKGDAPNGRTHFAKNSAHFWNGTEAEFDAQFSKK